MCDPGMNELMKQIKKHDHMNELEDFLKKSDQFKHRLWWISHAEEIRKLLAPFDETVKPIPPGTIIPERGKI